MRDGGHSMEEVSCLEGGDGELEISDEGQIFFFRSQRLRVRALAKMKDVS